MNPRNQLLKNLVKELKKQTSEFPELVILTREEAITSIVFVSNEVMNGQVMVDISNQMKCKDNEYIFITKSEAKLIIENLS